MQNGIVILRLAVVSLVAALLLPALAEATGPPSTEGIFPCDGRVKLKGKVKGAKALKTVSKLKFFGSSALFNADDYSFDPDLSLPGISGDITSRTEGNKPELQLDWDTSTQAAWETHLDMLIRDAFDEGGGDTLDLLEVSFQGVQSEAKFKRKSSPSGPIDSTKIKFKASFEVRSVVNGKEKTKTFVYSGKAEGSAQGFE